MARHSRNSNQGMHDTKQCYAIGCKLYDARKWSCCSIPYCVVHQEAKYHTHADKDPAIKFADIGWMPGMPVVLGPFEGMPAKKSLRMRKVAAKAART
jgi:hypothetical protein